MRTLLKYLKTILSLISKKIVNSIGTVKAAKCDLFGAKGN